jgi:hypothetical protein
VDPVSATLRRAREIHAEFARNTRAALSGAVTGRRPKGGGDAVRGEPLDCEACIAVGATAEESFLIHHSDASGRPLSGEPAAPVPVPDDAERRVRGGYAEISR